MVVDSFTHISGAKYYNLIHLLVLHHFLVGLVGRDLHLLPIQIDRQI